MLKSQKSEAAAPEGPDSIRLTKYMFEDKKKQVKVYIDLKDEVFGGRDIDESMVTFEPELTSLKMNIVDRESNSYSLDIKKLYDKIEPENSKITVEPNKRIKIYLKKWIETKWNCLAKKTTLSLIHI